MKNAPHHVYETLSRSFLREHPTDFARVLDGASAEEASRLLDRLALKDLLLLWPHLAPDTADVVILTMGEGRTRELIAGLDPVDGARLLSRLREDDRQRMIGLLDPDVAEDLRRLQDFPPDSAARLMDPRMVVFPAETTVRDALKRLQVRRPRFVRHFFLVDDAGAPVGRVPVEQMALTPPGSRLEAIAEPVQHAVNLMAERAEVIEQMERVRYSDLPVLDYGGKLVGIIHPDRIVEAVQEQSTVDIQTMFGASRDERALSRIGFAVKKRLPWLQINLGTAFLAASVVGLFEGTIAKFTALAVLLPVVAGQSGNSGAQALAVTMRGLALKEIGARHLFRVVFKEVNVGFMNGVAIALTTALGVYVWSRSAGLAFVIAISMVISMVAAGLAGATIPIMLTRLGQDPAQSSSIILTTVTDVVGFFSFLGIATLLANLL